MKRYQIRLKEKGLIQSMSRKGNCLDNSVIENFFGLLKTEMFYKYKFNLVEHLISKIENYIDYYNNKRIKCKLNNEEIKLAKSELYRLSTDSKEREQYNMREKAIYDRISALENAEAKGKLEGKIEGKLEIAKKNF